MQRLSYESEESIYINLLGQSLINRGLVILEDSKTILRRDYSNIIDKVKLISGGGSGNEPAFCGFVGPGMLTASISGDLSSAPTVYSIYKLIKEIGTNHSPGVLLIVPNYPGYRINFGLAKLRADSFGINVKMIIVDDDVSFEDDYPNMQKRGSVGILFIIKIAGAMAEYGESLVNINDMCNRIISGRKIVTISVGMRMSSSCEDNLCSKSDISTKIEIGYGIHGESGSLINKTSLKDVAAFVAHKLVNLSRNSDGIETSIRRFPENGKVAVIINNLGGSSQMEHNIFTYEVCVKLFRIQAERIYAGYLMTSLDSYGYQVSILNLSDEPDIIKYLDTPTFAPAWPKALTCEMIGFKHTLDLIVPGKYCTKDSNDLHCMDPQGAVIDKRSGLALLIIIIFACEALIACTEQLNKMDREIGNGDCGTKLAQGAKAIKTEIQKNKLDGTQLNVIFSHISCIMGKDMGGVQGGLYSLFFYVIAMTFRDTNDQITSNTWLKALTSGNDAISQCGAVSFGDRTMLDPLRAAQYKLASTLEKNIHPIEAFGEAVKAAEICAIETINSNAYRGAKLIKSETFKYADPGAHAVGIWMRAAYEGAKLKMICECKLEK